jgi:hypothetical protein
MIERRREQLLATGHFDNDEVFNRTQDQISALTKNLDFTNQEGNFMIRKKRTRWQWPPILNLKTTNPTRIPIT